jgi:hypothetical protein
MTGQHMTESSVIPDSTQMWLSHASAALVTIIALRFGGRAFWGLFETARLRLDRVVGRPDVHVVPMFAPVAVHGPADAPVLRDLGVLIGRMRHRGPPSVLLRAQFA